MHKFKIAAAQIAAVRGDVALNLETHAKAIEGAAKHKVSVLIFPELSLTGYEPSLAADLAFTKHDERLHLLSKLAQTHNMIVVVGAPLVSETIKPHIAALVIFGGGKITTYAKIHLHPGEEEFFSAGSMPCIVKAQAHSIGIAICADTTHPSHPEAYSTLGADIYAAGVFITEAGYGTDAALLESYAKDNDMLTIMANYNKPTDGLMPAGKSAAWAPGGKLVAMAGPAENALVIATRDSEQWLGSVVGI